MRGIKGTSWSNREDVITSVVDALDLILNDGPNDKKGHPIWNKFDWPARCNVVSASVYATAGMPHRRVRESRAEQGIVGARHNVPAT